MARKASEEFLGLYRLAVEMADRISARRATANSFFLTLNTGLSAFVGYRGGSRDFATITTAIVGVMLAGVWWLLLRSYRDLNAAKYQVIQQMEEQLEFALFTREWDLLKQDPLRARRGPLKRWRGRYAELGFAERLIPVAFAVVYVLLGSRAALK